jgi:hypothetical protein
MVWRLIWLVCTVGALATVSDVEQQYLCIGNFACYGPFLTFSVALLQSTECSWETFGVPAGNMLQMSLDKDYPATVNISIDWREQSQSTSTAETSERLSQFNYDYVVINFTANAIVSNLLQVQPSAVNDSQSLASFYSFDDTQPERQVVNIFHVYQHGQQFQLVVPYHPVRVVLLQAPNATKRNLATWEPAAWQPMTYNCKCQVLWSIDKDNDVSCNDQVQYCQQFLYYVDQQGVCTTDKPSELVPSASSSAFPTQRVPPASSSAIPTQLVPSVPRQSSVPAVRMTTSLLLTWLCVATLFF